MKSSVILVCFLIAMCVWSCSDPNDLMSPANLSGTIWKSSGESQMVYKLIKFTSKSNIEGWNKTIDADEELEWTGTYTVKKNQMTFNITTVDQTAYFSAIVTMTADTITFVNSAYVKQQQPGKPRTNL